SRRRHTRFSRDWSSDVCSSDLRISTGHDNARHLGFGVLALCFPMTEIRRVIEECGKASKRVRDLPAEVIAYYVIGLSLFPSVGYREVLGWLLCGLNWSKESESPPRLNSKGALSKARSALGAEPMRQAFLRVARRLARPGLPGSYWTGMHMVAIDGSTLALQDTPAIAGAFGRPGN